MRAGWRALRWPLLAGMLVAGLLLGAELRFALITKVRQEGAGKLAGVVVDRLHKEGLAATWKAAFNKMEDAVVSPQLQYSVFDPAAGPAADSAADRARLPEYKVIPGADPASLAPSRDTAQVYDQWWRSHGNDGSSKFASHTQINTRNVAQLQLAWTNASGANLGDPAKLGTTVQTNPVMAGGRLFVGGETTVRAIDAATGADVWVRPLPGPVARRGLAWEPNADFTQSRLFVPTAQGVYALRAADGRVLGDFGDKGRVGGELSLIAPLILKGRLIVAVARPALEAYDLQTGKLLWVRPLLDAAATRGTALYGGVPWAGMSGDAVRGMVYVSTGNARPQMVGNTRPGDNGNTCSVVAIDVETGAIRWAFQEVAHDLWDLDVPSPPVLTQISRGGKRVDVVAAVTKLGNTLLLDRDSGRPVFDYRLRRAPVSAIRGERTAAYQPALELPQPFSKLVFEPADITDLTASARQAVLRKTRDARFGFFEPPVLGGSVVAYGLQGGAEWPGAAADPHNGVLYVPSNELPWLVRAHYLNPQSSTEAAARLPGNALYQAACAGCHRPDGEGQYETEREGDLHYPVLNGITALRSREQLVSKAMFDRWHEAAQLPRAVSAQELAALFDYLSALDRSADAAHAFTLTGFWQVLLDDKGHPGSKPPWGRLTAIDLNTGKHLWQVPFGQYDKLLRDGKPVQGQRNHGGVMATAGGLLFATGTVDNKLRAFDAASGRELWSYKLPAAGSAPPTTYMLDGVQYVVVVAGGGQHVEFSGRSDKMLAFRLPSSAR